MEEQKNGAVGVLEAPTVEMPAVKPRKKRASKHDFKDGRGRVFAHRHVNGNGWVADTAKVADSVLVTKWAQVYHNATVEGRVSVMDRSHVCGNAVVRDNVRVRNNAIVSGRAHVGEDSQLWGNSRAYGGTVSGSTNVYDDAFVRDAARVISCTIRGSSGVAGRAVAIQVALDGMSYIGGEAQVSSSSLRGFVTVAGKAQVVGSKLMQVSIYSRAEDDPTIEMSRLKVVDYAIIANADQINALIAFCGHSVVAGGHIIFRPQHDSTVGRYTRVDTHDQALFANTFIDRIDQFNAFNVSRSDQRQQNLYRPTAAANLRPPVNMNELIPTRRLISM
jgi:carbonic anhydrase/acetyltransferase-like protein (isoleucine patch superfamily)